MRVAIYGGTGFVGGYLVDALISAGHDVSALVRPGSEEKLRYRDQLTATTGSLGSQNAIERTCDGCDAVIYNIGILREFPRRGITFEEAQYLGVERTIAAARKTGVSRFLLMSANGIRAGGTPYQDSKYRAEETLRMSGIDFTIFRPSVIFGDPKGLMEFATQLYQDMVLPPFPAIGFHTGLRPASGEILMSPVHVEDVAQAFVHSLEDDFTIGKTIRLGGPQALSWASMLRRIAAATGRKKIVIPMPIQLMKIAALLLDWIPRFPVTRDQLTMLSEGNTADPAELAQIIGREPYPFDEQTLSYLAR